MARKTAQVVRGQDDLSDQFLKCRAWRHPWDEYYPIGMEAPEYGWRESLRCTRCMTERHRIIDRKGAVVSTSYYYPAGYCLTRGSGKILVTDLRSTIFDRMREQLVAANAVSGAILSQKSKVISLESRKGA